MAKTAVLYRSKYGTTKRYAAWIAEETGGELFNAQTVSPNALHSFDAIVYCGGIYATQIIGLSLIKKRFAALRDKRIIVVAVGMGIPSEQSMEEIKNANFTAAMKAEVPLFVLRGGLSYSTMRCMHKMLMGALVRLFKKKPPEEQTEEERGMIAAFENDTSFVDFASIAPIVRAVKK